MMNRVATSRDARQFGTISHPASTNSSMIDQHSTGYHPSTGYKTQFGYAADLIDRLESPSTPIATEGVSERAAAPEGER